MHFSWIRRSELHHFCDCETVSVELFVSHLSSVWYSTQMCNLRPRAMNISSSAQVKGSMCLLNYKATETDTSGLLGVHNVRNVVYLRNNFSRFRVAVCLKTLRVNIWWCHVGSDSNLRRSGSLLLFLQTGQMIVITTTTKHLNNDVGALLRWRGWRDQKLLGTLERCVHFDEFWSNNKSTAGRANL